MPARPGAAAVLGPHASVFACPRCRAGLDAGPQSVACSSCGRQYLDESDRWADFLPGAAGSPGARHAPLRLQDPVIAARYETCSRPAFFRIMGGDWQGRLLPGEAEEDFLRTRLRAAAGVPVADIACGAGRWTKIIAGTVGAEEVICPDISRPLLRQCRAAVPGITAVRASALDLPLRDAVLGAAVIWNALQQMPHPGEAIAEAGRCLRPGGVLILLTYQPARPPLARYFQSRHEEAFGVASFTPAQMRGWLETAGLIPGEIGGPGSFLLVTARKPGTLPAAPCAGGKP
jgi:SAM-dependent methyltransferase